jgi:NADH:ubiquinone oxidoreductase subunit 6 (subunit J)
VTVADALLIALGAIAVGSGALVVTSSHLVRAGLYLVVSLGAIAGLYLVMGAELVAWVQVLVYVGAVVVLLLFAVMLTRAPIGASPDLDRPALPAAIIGAGTGFGLTALLADAFRWTEFELPPPGTAQRVGEQVFGAWVLPFEVLSILLLAALIGAIVLSRPDLGARPDPAAPAVEPTPDPVDESAEVVARLERIAARQAAAQARVRQAHAAEKAAEAAANAAAEPAAEPVDPMRQQAHDVIFGAHEARPRVGEPGQAEVIDSRIIHGESVVERDEPIPPRRSIEGNVIEGDLVEGKPKPESRPEPKPRPAIGKKDQPALPAPDDESKEN